MANYSAATSILVLILKFDIRPFFLDFHIALLCPVAHMVRTSTAMALELVTTIWHLISRIRMCWDKVRWAGV
jgi:hypothetical protein